MRTQTLAAAISVFADRGWAGFSIEAVARESGVGKASIYLRWSNKADLLFDALATHIRTQDAPDTGDIRSDLLTLVTELFDLYVSDAGRALLRMSAGGETIPGVWERFVKFQNQQTLAARALVRRAIDDGRLPSSTSVTLLLETLIGAVLLHSLSTPPDLRQTMTDSSHDYLSELVDYTLKNVETR
ncbi:TetR/AcrR family transcriptional regulator [Gordonia sp. (in: high G+C Gram-positive bacteria)]|uniref:TetR/AcrR family transcriptional regulator n=1 Tax=Gordonia sp. (in: high G+C Gram-positive bacteria) TaxID=84139 RepID=UPI003F948BDC